jgi:hypothetical protein
LQTEDQKQKVRKARTRAATSKDCRIGDNEIQKTDELKEHLPKIKQKKEALKEPPSWTHVPRL